MTISPNKFQIDKSLLFFRNKSNCILITIIIIAVIASALYKYDIILLLLRVFLFYQIELRVW